MVDTFYKVDTLRVMDTLRIVDTLRIIGVENKGLDGTDWAQIISTILAAITILVTVLLWYKQLEETRKDRYYDKRPILMLQTGVFQYSAKVYNTRNEAMIPAGDDNTCNIQRELTLQNFGSGPALLPNIYWSVKSIQYQFEADNKGSIKNVPWSEIPGGYVREEHARVESIIDSGSHVSLAKYPKLIRQFQPLSGSISISGKVFIHYNDSFGHTILTTHTYMVRVQSVPGASESKCVLSISAPNYNTKTYEPRKNKVNG